MKSKELEVFMAEKGLGYTAWSKSEATQILMAAGDTTSGVLARDVVIARVCHPGSRDTFHFGYYPPDEAMEVARKIKRLRKVDVDNVTVIHSATRI